MTYDRENSGHSNTYQSCVMSCASSHCILHRQELVVRTMEKDLRTVLDDAVKIVNYIKSSPLNA